MKITFLGTRGEIEPRTRRHRRHSSLLVTYRRRSVMVDCGADWLGRLDEIRPHAIVLTHAHPDHAWGLENGSPAPVYATQITWRALEGYPVEDRRTVEPGRAETVEGISFEAFEVEHSIRCPAVSYRISAGRATVHYAPDVVYIHDRRAALHGVRLYIGDGATLHRPMVRKRGDGLIGHTPVRTQLTWCEKEGVPEAWFSHCGAQIVDGDERRLGAELRRWGRARGVDARIAYDGLQLTLR